jgi:lipoprotein signal peptidase
MMRVSGRFKFFFVALTVFLFDQVSKFFASQAGVVTVNTGMSFQLLETLPVWGWLILTAVVAIFLFLAFRSTWRRLPVWGGIFFGGVISNAADRILVGGVRDFLPLPIGNLQNNLADYAIVVSVIGLVWSEWRAEQVSTQKKS